MHTLTYYQPSVNLLLAQQSEDGYIPWTKAEHADPWNMVEAAIGLAIGGAIEPAYKTYDWLKGHQLANGGYYATYVKGKPEQRHQVSHTFGYSAVGLWHLYQLGQPLKRISQYWNMVEAALDTIVELQSEQGDIAWCVNEDGSLGDDALIAGSSSTYKSLRCGYALGCALGYQKSDWLKASNLLSRALQLKPYRFNRTWPAKDFAMDWYYPAMNGAIPDEMARRRLPKDFNKYVDPNLGVRCQKFESWFTVAETCELVIALVRLGHRQQALALFTTIDQHRNAAGEYWMGWVANSRRYWPDYCPTWTAGVVLMAADALFQLTSAHSVFISDPNHELISETNLRN